MIYFGPRDDAVVPAKAHKGRRETGWPSRWFYLSAEEGRSLRSSGTETEPGLAPAVTVDDRLLAEVRTLANISRPLSIRDLVEEFMAARSWPLA